MKNENLKKVQSTVKNVNEALKLASTLLKAWNGKKD
jgi:hypothetical protein